jgi:hypothetical protein
MNRGYGRGVGCGPEPPALLPIRLAGRDDGKLVGDALETILFMAGELIMPQNYYLRTRRIVSTVQ